MKHLLKFTLILSGLLMFSVANSKETHTVKGVGIQFKPDIVFASQGDIIEFRDMPTHFVDVVKIPDGAEKMISDMGANYSYIVDKPGIYFYKCPPHWGGRMGGLIIVGEDLQNEESLTEALTEYKDSIKDTIGQSYLKKVLKNIKNGKIKIPK
ncbi:MAG: plastocyanin/azurin family copper-binding protein [Methylococcaceae bacterium]|nr:plastocyanin/azurin family copper-binding protein [Methylococcaceae bacterium]